MLLAGPAQVKVPRVLHLHSVAGASTRLESCARPDMPLRAWLLEESQQLAIGMFSLL